MDYYLRATQSAHRRELWRARLEMAKLLLLLVALYGALVAIWVLGETGMTMTLKEAAAAVADLYEAIPETYCRGSYWYAYDGDLLLLDNRKAVTWCAVGGIQLATNRAFDEIEKWLEPCAQKLGYGEAIAASDRNRRTAIKLLRMAAQ